MLPVASSRFVAVHLLPHLTLSLTTRTSLEIFLNTISIYCHWIHLESSKLTSGSLLSKVPKCSATNISQCRGPPRSCFKSCCLLITDQCLFSSNPATHTFFHFLKVLQLKFPIHLAIWFKENSIGFRRFGALHLAQRMCHELLCLSSASNSSWELSGYSGKIRIAAKLVLSWSAAIWPTLAGRHMVGPRSLLDCLLRALHTKHIGRMTGLYSAGATYTHGVPAHILSIADGGLC